MGSFDGKLGGVRNDLGGKSNLVEVDVAERGSRMGTWQDYGQVAQ